MVSLCLDQFSCSCQLFKFSFNFLIRYTTICKCYFCDHSIVFSNWHLLPMLDILKILVKLVLQVSYTNGYHKL